MVPEWLIMESPAHMRRALILVLPGIPLLAQLFRQIFGELVVDQFA